MQRLEVMWQWVHDDGLWMHRTNGWYFPDAPSFLYHMNSAREWPQHPEIEIRNAETWWYKLYRPQPGDVVLDIGAGRGEDVISFSQCVGKEGRVIAVEANPRSFQFLRTFCATNHLDNVVPVHAAVTDKPQRLHVVESQSGEWEADFVSRDAAGIEVDGITLDRLCKIHLVNEIALLKMNIEGAERLALDGLQRSRSKVRAICVCCHDFRSDRGESEEFRTRVFVENYLRANGFEVKSVEFQYEFERDHIHAVRTGEFA